ncbi:uncharacterized protein LOC131952487 [Physella acuta]|uniref:uncharacterized protein LOC131952487 n=1 Tax=Physella acuta TaxID=109671 RepID=UPI0027DB2606|nr:uncharacterized protein LOC131952487 [Physella acuta]
MDQGGDKTLLLSADENDFEPEISDSRYQRRGYRKHRKTVVSDHDRHSVKSESTRYSVEFESREGTLGSRSFPAVHYTNSSADYSHWATTDYPISTTKGYPKRATTDYPIRATKDYQKRATTDYPIRATNVYPKRNTTDYPKSATTDNPIRATTDNPERARTDSPKRATTDSTKRATTDSPNRTTTDSTNRATTDSTNRATTDSSQRASTEYPNIVSIDYPTRATTFYPKNDSTPDHRIATTAYSHGTHHAYTHSNVKTKTPTKSLTPTPSPYPTGINSEQTPSLSMLNTKYRNITNSPYWRDALMPQGGAQPMYPGSYAPWQHPPEESFQQVPNYKKMSICILCFCCLPLGIAGLIYTTKAEKLRAEKKYSQAKTVANKAKIVNIIGFVLGIFLWILNGLVIYFKVKHIQDHETQYNYSRP